MILLRRHDYTAQFQNYLLNSISMQFGNIKYRKKGKIQHYDNSGIGQHKPASKSVMVQDISQLVLALRSTKSVHTRSQLLRQIIQSCYGNKNSQVFLCNILSVPYFSGPVSINCLPPSYAGRSRELAKLFRFLKQTKQYFYCWIIYPDHDLKILNIKMLTKFQFQEYGGQFDLDNMLVGVFVGKQYQQKVRAVSSKLNLSVSSDIHLQKNAVQTKDSFGLSTKATKDSIHSPSRSFFIPTKPPKTTILSSSINSSQNNLNPLKTKTKKNTNEAQTESKPQNKTVNPFIKKPVLRRK